MEDQDKRSKNSSSDEIDLTHVFRWIGQGFRNAGSNILYGLAKLRQIVFSNSIFFGTLIAIGLATGTLYSELIKKEFYKSSMILSCDYLNSRIITNSIEKLNLLSAERAREGLAEELKIDLLTAQNILGFESRPFVAEKDLIEIEVLKTQLNNVAENKIDLVNKVISKVDIENKHAFQIEITVFDPSVIKNLEIALKDYFRNNSYIKNRIEIHHTNLLKRKEKLLRESKKLDSLKEVLYSNLKSMATQRREGSNNVILTDKYISDPLAIYKEDLEINAEMLNIERQIFTRPDFEIIDPFTTFKEPESASLPKILVISFLASWLMGYLILGLWKFDRYLAKLSKESN